MLALVATLLLITASWEADQLDPSDIDATFARVFAKLPAEVTVYPSENYYYWQIKTPDGETTWGNLRLAANRRDQGQLSFAAATKHKTFSAKDGVMIERLTPLKYAVTAQEKRVVFHLNPLVQSPPKKFALRKGEQFVQRTYDESGLQFILLYNTTFKDFLWVLNEEEGVKKTETFEPDGPALIGKRSGFVFWQNGDRKILAAVSRANIGANNYFDGPFDQLADNFAKQTPLRKYLIHRDPNLENQIDAYGNFKNSTPTTRVALTNYLKYRNKKEAIDFVKQATQSANPYQHISSGSQ